MSFRETAPPLKFLRQIATKSKEWEIANHLFRLVVNLTKAGSLSWCYSICRNDKSPNVSESAPRFLFERSELKQLNTIFYCINVPFSEFADTEQF